MRYVPFAFILALLGWFTFKRSPMQKAKPKKIERVSPKWLNENVYNEGQGGDAA